jgi:hypothetical protein
VIQRDAGPGGSSSRRPAPVTPLPSLTMSSLILPRSVARDLHERTVSFRADVLASIVTDDSDPLLSEYTRRLQAIDPRLLLVRAQETVVPGVPMRPGYYHLMVDNGLDAPLSVTVIEGADGEFCEPTSRSSRSCSRVTCASSATLTGGPPPSMSATTPVERDKARDRQRREHLRELVTAYTETSVSLNTARPWTQNNQPNARVTPGSASELGEATQAVMDRGFDYLSAPRVYLMLNTAKDNFEDIWRWPWLDVVTTGPTPLTIADLKLVMMVKNALTADELLGLDMSQVMQDFTDLNGGGHAGVLVAGGRHDPARVARRRRHRAACTTSPTARRSSPRPTRRGSRPATTTCGWTWRSVRPTRTPTTSRRRSCCAPTCTR